MEQLNVVNVMCAAYRFGRNLRGETLGLIADRLVDLARVAAGPAKTPAAFASSRRAARARRAECSLLANGQAQLRCEAVGFARPEHEDPLGSLEEEGDPIRAPRRKGEERVLRNLHTSTVVAPSANACSDAGSR